ADDLSDDDTYFYDTQDPFGYRRDVYAIDGEAVGPFEHRIVEATDVGALVAWLLDPDGDPGTDDAYALPRGLGGALDPYVGEGRYFVVLEVTPDPIRGAIPPLRLTYASDHMTLPMVPTAVAARRRLPLEVYVLGEHRAVPDNHLHVELNPAAIDWLQHGHNRHDVLRRAVDEAGGQAFVTDHAGPVP
ncbi:MAG: DUF2330 domain-containing protein, partial [Myxococcales bacterium]|nr:DUF2330 domain-containing protein [Myxococcales bacterium]